MPPDPERDLQHLLAEEPFVRELARQLIVDDADEIVQQTWLHAVQRGGAGIERPRHWLARILRNLASNLRRDTRRRRARLETLPPPELVPSSAALAEREERRRALVAAVDALPSHLRTVVMLRWFEGHPPRRIAAALGVPAATVSTQLQRALALLRQRLDAEHGGDRRAWLVPLVPFVIRPELPLGPAALPSAAAPAAPALLLGAIAMTTKIKLVASALALLVAATVWFALQGGEPAVAPSTGTADMTSADRVRASIAGSTIPDPTPVVASPERSTATPTAATPVTGSVLVHVRYGDDKSPVVGRTMILRPAGVDPRFSGLRLPTDDTGSVRYDGIPPGRNHVSDGHLPGMSVEVVAGQTAEITLDLEVGLTVTGIVVDAARTPVPGAQIEVAPMAHSQALPVVLAVTGADGRFTARACFDLCLVGARATGHSGSAVRFLHGKQGNTADIELVLGPNGGDLAGTVVDSTGKPVADAIVVVGAGKLTGIVGQDNIAPFPALTRSDVDGRFRAVGIAAGTHPVRVRAPRFAPWSGTCAIVAGTTATQRIELGSGGVLRGIVRDAIGTPVARADLEVGDWNDDLGHFQESSAADGSFELAGLPTGELLLRANHRTHGRAELRVTTTPEATAKIDVPLSRGIELRGSVVDADGQPIAEAWLECFGESGGTGRWSTFVKSDAQGRFTATNCPEAGRISIQVSAKGFQRLRETRIDPRTPDLQLRLQRAEPATVRISARIVGPDGKPIANASVSAGRKDVRDSSGTLATDNDGRIEFGPLVPGTWQLSVYIKGLPDFQSEPRPLAANAHWDCGTITLEVGGTARIAVNGGKLPGAYVLVTNTARTRSWAVADTDFGYRTSTLAPGDYALLVSGPGIAAEAVPFTIRAAEEGTVPLRMQAGVAQGFQCNLPADTKADGVSLHVRRGDVFVGRIWVGLSEERPVELSLLPGDYTVSGEIGTLRGSASFTVGPVSSAPLTVTLR